MFKVARQVRLSKQSGKPKSNESFLKKENNCVQSPMERPHEVFRNERQHGSTKIILSH